MFNAIYDFGDRKEPVRIIATGDWHMEKRFFVQSPSLYPFQTRAFFNFMEEIRKPNTYWIHVGDLFNDHRTTTRKALAFLENDGRGGKLSDDDCMDMDFWDRKLIPTLEKIKDKCLGIVRGNHYRRYGNGDTNIDYVCRKAGLPVLGEHRGFLSLRFRRGESRRSLKVFMTHGSGGNSKNDMGKLKDQTGTEQADIILGGHTHRLGADVSAIRKASDGDIHTRAKVYMRCGAMRITGVKGADTYDDLADYGALPVGMGVLNIYPLKSQGNLYFKVYPELQPFDYI